MGLHRELEVLVMRTKQNIKGFTLAELLIVVAIIGVLVAIAIPIFTSQLEKSREATDAANIRSHYAMVMTEALSTGNSVNGSIAFGPVQLKQKEDGWMSSQIGENLESVYGGNIIGDGPAAGGMAWVEYNMDTGTPILHYGGGSAGGSTPAEGDPSESSPSGSDLEKLNNSGDDWDSLTSGKDSFTIMPGEVYRWNEKIYFGIEERLLNEWQLENWNPDILVGYWSLREFSGKIWEEGDFDHERNDVTEGDICKVGDKYYVFKDGGHVSRGPVHQEGQWMEVHING